MSQYEIQRGLDFKDVSYTYILMYINVYNIILNSFWKFSGGLYPHYSVHLLWSYFTLTGNFVFSILNAIS
jgi:hypothetical protein